MRKQLFISLLLFLVGVAHAQQTGSIEGRVEGLAEGQLHLSVRISESRWDTLCTVPFNASGFSMRNIKVDEPLPACLSVDGYQGGFFFFIEPGTAYRALLRDGEGWFVRGKGLQDRQMAYQQTCKTLLQAQAKLQHMADSLQKALRYGSASRVNDTIAQLRKEQENLRQHFLSANDNLLSAHLFLQQVEAKDAPLTVCQQLYAQLGDGAKQSRSGVILQQRINRLSMVSQGSQAPDFTLPTLSGGEFTLSKMKGRVKIVDFWASWCGPCRLNNPVLRQLYADFHTQGLEIVNVSLDENRGRWAEAVKKDGLSWTQVSSLKGWKDEVAKRYSVTAIPAIFVLDADNRIVATGLHGESLKSFVTSLFNK